MSLSRCVNMMTWHELRRTVLQVNTHLNQSTQSIWHTVLQTAELFFFRSYYAKMRKKKESTSGRFKSFIRICANTILQSSEYLSCLELSIFDKSKTKNEQKKTRRQKSGKKQGNSNSMTTSTLTSMIVVTIKHGNGSNMNASY